MRKSSTRSDSNKRKAIVKWKALITSFLMQSLVLGTIESYGALYVPIKETYFEAMPGRSSISAMIGSLTTGFLMGFSPVSSLLIDLAGPQIVAFSGGVLVFLSTLFTSFIDTFFLMALFYGVFFGIGASMLFISSNVVISRYFEENSTLAYGILGLGNGLMNSIMPHVISYCVESIHIGGTIRVISLLLSCIMFFPLYWNKDANVNKEENLLAYIPSKIIGKHNTTMKLMQSEIEGNIREVIEEETVAVGSLRIIKSIDNANEDSTAAVVNEVINPEEDRNIIPRKRNMSIINVPQQNMPRQSKKSEHSELKAVNVEGALPSLFERLSSKLTSHSTTEEDSQAVDNKSSGLLARLKRFRCCKPDSCNSKPYRTMLIAMPIAMLGYQVPNVHIVNFAGRVAPEYNGQLLLTCIGGSAAIGPFVTGLAMDRISYGLSKYRLYQIFVIAYGIIILTLALKPSYYALLFICLVIGFIDGSFSSLIGPLAIDLVGVDRAGQAIGLFYGCIAPSVTVAPPLAGILYDSFGSYRYSFFCAGVCFLLGGLLLSISHGGQEFPKRRVSKFSAAVNFKTSTTESL